MIEIMNLRHEKPSELYDVRVDRKSILGNPFFMEDESKRDEICDKYYIWFGKSLKNMRNTLFGEELVRLKSIYTMHGKLRLFCWCAPKRCHGETIRNYLFN